MISFLIIAWAFGFGMEFPERRTHLLFTAAALHGECDFRSRWRRRNRVAERIRIRDSLPVERSDHIALLQPRSIGPTSRLHLVNNHARSLCNTKPRSFFRRNRKHNNPELTASDFAPTDQLLHHVAGHV